MVFPDGTQMANAGTALTNAYNAFLILATVLAIVVVLAFAPIVIRLVRRVINADAFWKDTEEHYFREYPGIYRVVKDKDSWEDTSRGYAQHSKGWVKRVRRNRFTGKRR